MSFPWELHPLLLRNQRKAAFQVPVTPNGQNAEQHWAGGRGTVYTAARHMYPFMAELSAYTILLISLPLIDIWGVSTLGHWE